MRATIDKIHIDSNTEPEPFGDVGLRSPWETSHYWTRCGTFLVGDLRWIAHTNVIPEPPASVPGHPPSSGELPSAMVAWLATTQLVGLKPVAGYTLMGSADGDDQVYEVVTHAGGRVQIPATTAEILDYNTRVSGPVELFANSTTLAWCRNGELLAAQLTAASNARRYVMEPFRDGACPLRPATRG